MKSTEHWLVHKHTFFEAQLRECRKAADISDWCVVEQFFLELVKQLRYHMAQEEEVLFPAYDAKCKPSHMQSRELRNEHSVIVDSFRQLAKNINYSEHSKIVKGLAQLELFLFEHNEKEEKVFLPFASHLLFDDRDELAEKLENFVVSNQSRRWIT